ncbi:outer membrane lipoprotein [Kingella potus]|uniref:Outer membrane lipoprotein n=1 Tax=Kingella potus TaxID=265175 RepID=A0A377R284_9NEIS|nr:BON domain-containing protein [Kingella potus]UOP00602.1 BON domain-containing protein [Kingella potus]STR03000.1 outer membrane lipoprotein [Kingella potus]
MTTNRLKTLSAALLAALLLNGCAAAIIGGAAAGTSSAIDRRTTGAQADDQIIELRVKNTATAYLKQHSPADGFTPNLSVISYNRHILLLGKVANESERQFVEQVARSEQSAEAVYNYIEVNPQARSFGSISADTWSTAKVKTMIGAGGVYPGRVKIVTYDGVTYAMGILTPEEQAAVTQKVSTTAGVQKVITLYQNYTPQK